MKLNYQTLGQSNGLAPVMILHGVFGSLGNWMSIGKKLAQTHQVYLVDQRNHGNSPHDDQFDHPSMSSDLLELIQDLKLDKVHLVGHSMGGKTAMYFASQEPSYLASLIAVDIATKSYPPHHQEIFKAHNVVNPDTLTSRNEAVSRISEVISDKSIQQFLLKNLERTTQNTFRWKHNLSVIESNIEKIGDRLPDNYLFNGPTIFMRGSLSDYIKDEDESVIKSHFPKAEVRRIENAGHWIHADQPGKFVETVLSFLQKVEQ
jgi:esterase